MALTFLPPPSRAAITARLEDLPADIAALGRHVLTAPGTTADVLLVVADAADISATELELLVRGDFVARHWRSLAAILRDAAPGFPTPPREPATPLAGWLSRARPGIGR
jgi:hypothetical protein